MAKLLVALLLLFLSLQKIAAVYGSILKGDNELPQQIRSESLKLRSELDTCQIDPEKCLSGRRGHFESGRNATAVNGTNTTHHASTGFQFTMSKTDGAQNHQRTHSPYAASSSLTWIYGTGLSSSPSRSSISGTAPPSLGLRGTGLPVPLYPRPASAGASDVDLTHPNRLVGERVRVMQSSGHVQGQ